MYEKIVLCDFDGTATIEDVTDGILKNFAPKYWVDIGKEYLSGNISHSEMNKMFTDLLSVSPSLLKRFLKSEIHIRDGFFDLTKFLSKNGIPLVIVSSGWDFYIKEVLNSDNLLFLKTPEDFYQVEHTHVNVVANHTFFSNKFRRWVITFPWINYSCKISSPCKGMVLDLLREKCANRVIVVGNSSTDICMVENSNETFSTGELTEICRKKGFVNHSFDSFEQIVYSLSKPTFNKR